MSNKIKKVINTKPFYFILGALIFGTIGVSAATYFPSNDVIYDNTESGLTSTNVQGAIDELYDVCKTSTSISIGNQTINIVTSGDGLYFDEYEGRYMYKGANPNNYLKFNNELWRIISIEPDKTIKIILNDRMGTRAFDSSTNNNWTRPATLNTYLNSTYYNNFNSTAQQQIDYHDFNIGPTYLDYDLGTIIKNEKKEKWVGNIALITVSEYIRANSNTAQCNSNELISRNDDICKKTNWVHQITYNGYEACWTLTIPEDSSRYVYIIGRYDGAISSEYAWDANNGILYFHPVLYLKSDVKITKGNGSKSNPFVVN